MVSKTVHLSQKYIRNSKADKTCSQCADDCICYNLIDASIYNWNYIASLDAQNRATKIPSFQLTMLNVDQVQLSDMSNARTFHRQTWHNVIC